MRQIRPYQTAQGAKRALDNGGRFYNLFSQAGDDVVEGSELARAAGVVSADAKAFMHFQMALMELPERQQAEVQALLSLNLREKLEAKRAQVLLPSRVEAEAGAGQAAIITGYPFFVEDKSQFTGFIIIVTPVLAMIPIFEMYDVYEVFDTPARTERRTVLATVRGSNRLDVVPYRFGGMLKELQFEDKTGKDHGLYLEAIYYTPLPKEIDT
jgi:hypothetical protein